MNLFLCTWNIIKNREGHFKLCLTSISLIFADFADLFLFLMCLIRSNIQVNPAIFFIHIFIKNRPNQFQNLMFWLILNCFLKFLFVNARQCLIKVRKSKRNVRFCLKIIQSVVDCFLRRRNYEEWLENLENQRKNLVPKKCFSI